MKTSKIIFGSIFLLIGFFVIFTSYYHTVHFDLKDLIVIIPLLIIGSTLIYQRNNDSFFKWNKIPILIISFLLIIIFTWIDFKIKQSLCTGRSCGVNTGGFPIPFIPSVANSDAQGSFFWLAPLIGLIIDWVFYYIITRSIWKMFSIKTN